MRNAVYHKLQAQSLHTCIASESATDEPGDGGRGRAAVVHLGHGIDRDHGRGVLWLGTVALVMRWTGGRDGVAGAAVIVYFMLRIFNARIAADLQGGARRGRRGLDPAAGETVGRRRHQDLRAGEGRGTALSETD
jgi:hypothetical protein